jgi:hypothetical protein
MKGCHRTNLYDPLDQLTFTLFEENRNAKQEVAAKKVKAYLDSLDLQQLQHESGKFYEWIVVWNVDSHVTYAQSLLDYFHSKDMLLQKKEVQTLPKQDKSRYVVIYDMNGKVFSKVYNSVREIREDTGKKPSKICKLKI